MFESVHSTNKMIESYIVLEVGAATSNEQLAATLVVSVLAAEVKSCKASKVLDVHVGLTLAKSGNGTAEPFPTGLVQCSISVLKYSCIKNLLQKHC